MNSALPDAKTIYSFEELLELEELTGLKYELLDGQIVAMTGGTKAHNLIALGLFSEIDGQKEEGCRLYVADVKLQIDRERRINEKDNSAYPDVMLACGEEGSELYEESPLLLAEVLSDSTARKDKGAKREKYLAIESLQCYLILSQTEVMVTVYQRREDGWVKDFYLGKETEVEIPLGHQHRGLKLNLGQVYKYVENRI